MKSSDSILREAAIHCQRHLIETHIGDTGGHCRLSRSTSHRFGLLAARQKLAAALDADGQWSASVVEMRRVLQQVPDSAVWHANTGAVLAKSGQYEEAIRE